jgi:hypothetical protein
MSNEIQFTDASGNTDYATITNSVGQWWNGSAFESFNGAHWGNYAVSAAEFGTSGTYAASAPGMAAGVYGVVARTQAGGSPAEGDAVVAEGELEWDGADVAYLANVTLNVGVGASPSFGSFTVSGGMVLNNSQSNGVPLVIEATNGSADAVMIVGIGGGNGALIQGGSGSNANGAAIYAPGSGGNALWLTGDVNGLFASGTHGPGIQSDITGNITGNLSGSIGSVGAGGIDDASFTVPSDGTGQATGVLSMLLWLYNRFFGKVINDKVGGTIKTYQSGGATRTTQTVSSSSSADEIDSAT